MFVPSKLFLTKGIGKHREKLTSFEMALRDAKIAEFNLVKVSSIIPPTCKIIPVHQGLQTLQRGEIIYCVLSENSANEPHRLIAASIGVAIPKAEHLHGYLSEHHSFGQTDEIAGEYAEELAAYMLATILGVEFDPSQSFDKQQNIWKISGYEVTTRNITQSATCDKEGLWTTVVAAAVFVP